MRYVLHFFCSKYSPSRLSDKRIRGIDTSILLFLNASILSFLDRTFSPFLSHESLSNTKNIKTWRRLAVNATNKSARKSHSREWSAPPLPPSEALLSHPRTSLIRYAGSRSPPRDSRRRVASLRAARASSLVAIPRLVGVSRVIPRRKAACEGLTPRVRGKAIVVFATGWVPSVGQNISCPSEKQDLSLENVRYRGCARGGRVNSEWQIRG